MLISTVTLLATYTFAQTSFGIRAGVNFQNINGEDEAGDKLDNKMATKFHVGVQADIPVGTDFYFQPGLLFNNKGSKLNYNGMVESNVNLGYLELPLSLVYKPTLGAGNLILGFGPYVGFGITGKAKDSKFVGQDITLGVEYKNDVLDSDPDDNIYFKRMDGGANIFAGYGFAENLFIQLNAQLGLMNITPKREGNDPEGKSKHTGFGVSIGYNF